MTLTATTTSYTRRLREYRVRMLCGHFEDRLMSEGTAGREWQGPDTVAMRPASAACVGCHPARAALNVRLSANQAEG